MVAEYVMHSTCTVKLHSGLQTFCNISTNALQCTARHRNGPQAFCNVPQRCTTCRNARQHTERHCNGLQAFSQRFCSTTMHCGLFVCLLDRIRHPGKTAEWIGTQLGILVGVRLCIHVLDFGGDCQRGRDSFGGEFGTLHGCQ